MHRMGKGGGGGTKKRKGGLKSEKGENTNIGCLISLLLGFKRRTGGV